MGDVRGQRIILAQKLKLPDGKECKTDCLTAQRIVNKDLLEFGEWNSNTGVFKSYLAARLPIPLREVKRRGSP